MSSQETVKIISCPECGEPMPAYAQKCFNCVIIANFGKPEEYGVCDITLNLCPEKGLCAVTWNTYKPLPEVNRENFKDKLSEAGDFCWLANYAQHTQSKYSGMAENGIPNWQCPHFSRGKR